MPVAKRPATISDVARRAGVSIATVSRVLNATTPVDKKKTQKIEAAIRDLNYVPRSTARGLASRRTNAIGLLLPEIGGWYFPSLLRGIEAGAREAGFDLMIHTVDVTYPLKVSRRALGMHNTDGLIVFTNSVGMEELSLLRERGFPVILLHQTPSPSMDIPVVTIENKSGAQKIVEHLIEVHHCRHIAFLRGPEGHEDSDWRERGYREALEKGGLRFDPNLVSRGGFDENLAAEAVAGWVRQGLKFDAIFSGDDDAALGVIRALREAGLHVPDEIAVVGFDDIPLARFLNPSLTTVHAPTEQVGRDAIQQLVNLIRGEKTLPLTLLPTELIVRKSCGC